MTSRQRVIKAINHVEPDRVPLDFGATGQTGISASTLYKLRKELGLEEKPVYVHEPFQLLGWIEKDLRDLLGVDIIGLWSPYNLLGFKNENWKPWRLPDGTPVMMGGDFAYHLDDGVTYAYPQGDRTAQPSVKLPRDGFFFDNIDRGRYEVGNLDARRDFKDLYSVYTDEVGRYFEMESKRLSDQTEYAVVLNFGGGSFGDVAVIPGPYEKNPRGIRNLEDWFVAHVLHSSYVRELFEMQAEIAVKNLEILWQSVGGRVQIVQVSATDFGSQNGELFSPDQYRELYKPFHRIVNNWIHEKTDWKIQFHCCGSILRLLPDFIDAGVDILNPVQCSAEGMDPVLLKDKFGDKLTFWGGGVDTQSTLPFGTSDQVREQVGRRLEIFSRGGGYVFNTVHNVLSSAPVENVIALFDEFHRFNDNLNSHFGSSK